MSEQEAKFIELLKTDLDGSDEVVHTTEYLRNNGQEIENTPHAEISAYIGLLANEAYINDGLLTGDRESIERQVDSWLIQPHEIPFSQFDLSLADESSPDPVIDSFRRGMIDGIQSIQRDRLLEWAEYLGENQDLPDSFKLYVWEELANPYAVYMNHTTIDNADHAAFDLTPRKVLNPQENDIGPCPPLNHDAIEKAYEQMAEAVEDYDDESTESYYSVPRFTNLYKEALADVSITIDQDEASPVQDYFKKVANKFIEDGELITLIDEYIEYVADGSIDFASVISEWGPFEADISEHILDNIRAFDPESIDHNALLEKLTEYGCIDAIYQNIETFKEHADTEYVARAIAEAMWDSSISEAQNDLSAVIQSADTDAQKAIFDKLKTEKLTHLLADRLELFTEGVVDHQELVDELTSIGDIETLIINMDKFDPSAIDQEALVLTALENIDGDSQIAFFQNIDKFDPKIIAEHAPPEMIAFLRLIDAIE